MSTKNAYQLINPYIEGSLNTVVRASNSFNAGKKLYNNISTYFTNQVDDFYMTVQNVETKDLTHFKIGERRGENGTVDFDLVKLDDTFNPDIDKKLITAVEKLRKQSGGKHRYDDSSSSESSSDLDDYDYFRYAVQPINKFTYFYLPYYKLNMVGLSALDRSRIFMPMFSLPINPSLEIRFDIYKY